jgi:membrane protein
MRHRPKRSPVLKWLSSAHAKRIAPTALFSLSFAAVYKTIAAAFRKFNQDDGTFLASGLAFGLLFYSVPFTLLTLSALSYTAVQSDTALAWIRRISLNLVPHSRDLFDSFITDVVKRRDLLGFSGFIAFLFASSTTFGSVRLVLNRVFGAREHRSAVHGKLMEVVMMFGTSLLFFIVIGVVYVINLAHSFLESFWFEKYLHPEVMFVGWLVGLASTFALFLFLYRFSPARTLDRSGLLAASGTATFLFQISKWAFGIYLQYAQTTTAIYGALSALVFFFLWLYYACTIFVFSAEIGCVWNEKF